MDAPSILVVEDDTDIRENLKELLELEGYAVSSARDGQEALELLTAGSVRPGLILLDLMMPVMNGEAFLNAVATSSPELARIPVVVLTAAGSIDLPKTAGLLKKPIDVDELLRTIARLGNPAGPPAPSVIPS